MDRATGLVAELLKTFEDRIESVTVVPSDDGRFEVSLDGRLIYSKLETGRHAQPGEVVRLVQESLAQAGS